MPARAPATYADLLAGLVDDDPGRPLVTFYDHASGERVELSVATYANWVAKTASLLADECDLERGQRLLVDLPTHWLGPVFLGAAWTVGLTLTETADDADGVVCGPNRVGDRASLADRIPVLACSLRPLGVRFADPLPPGVRDVGVEVWSQPDAFIALDPPVPDDPAVGDRTQAELIAEARAAPWPAGVRLLSTANPVAGEGMTAFLGAVARSGSVVVVAHPDAHRLDATCSEERATARFPRPAE